MPRHVLQPLPRAFVGGHRETNAPKNALQDERIWEKLDRCQVLGTSSEGHRGCVNALSWSDDGSTLLSGSDDKRICIWTADTSSSTTSTSPHPLKLVDTIATGHRANIFSAKFLPNTSTPTIVSCAGDYGVRIFEVDKLGRAEVGMGMGVRDELWGFDGPGVRVLRCHTDRTKRIATENSPFLFLTVSEDGTVRQHDLRRPHVCRSECPEPLFRAPRGIDLYSLSVSTVTPHMFAVAGRTDCAYLCDRRMLERQTPSWGPNTQSSEQVHCVRRLGMTDAQWGKKRSDGIFASERHITCVKMSPHNADEVICAFASHSTGLFSTYDSPGPSNMRQRSSSPTIVPPNGSPKQSRSPRGYNERDFLRDTSPRLGKRRQSVLSSTAANPAPLQRQRSEDGTDSDSGAGPVMHDRSSEAGPAASSRSASPTTVQQRRLAVPDNFLEEPPGSTGMDVTVGEGNDHGPDHSDQRSSGGDRIREEMRHLLDAEDEPGPSTSESDVTPMDLDMDMDMDIELVEDDELVDEDDDEDDFLDEDDMEEEEDDDDDDFEDAMGLMTQGQRPNIFDSVDMITPRMNYKGAKSMETVKDCNFLGARSDKVASGSDDGNFFVWDKQSGKLEGIWEGDGSVVNVMEQHPTLPLVAVSGIDNTVKMFAPLAKRPDPSFARLHLRESIIKANTDVRSFPTGGGFATVSLLDFLRQRGIHATFTNPGGETDDGEDDDEDGESGEAQQCPTQ